MTRTDTTLPALGQAPAAPPWLQQHLLIADRADGHAEQFAAARLGPGMAALEAAGVITAWHFLRKGDRWRLRYQPPPTGTPRRRPPPSPPCSGPDWPPAH